MLSIRGEGAGISYVHLARVPPVDDDDDDDDDDDNVA